jgi:hypothetical protein
MAHQKTGTTVSPVGTSAAESIPLAMKIRKFSLFEPAAEMLFLLTRLQLNQSLWPP